MEAILHTFGASKSWALIASMHFSHAITPATLSRPNQDIGQLKEARVAGLQGLIFDLSHYSHTLSSSAMMLNLAEWMQAVSTQAGFTGVWMTDLDKLDVGAFGVLDACREYGLWTAASFTAQAGNLGEACAHIDAACKPFYKYWGGDGEQESTVEQDGATITSLWEAFQDDVPSGVEKWPMLQGFYDRKWGVTSINKPPSADNLTTVYGALTDVAVDDTPYIVFGLSAFPGTQRRYLCIGQEPSYVDALGMFNGTRRGRVYISPSYALVRRGETRALTCSVSGVAWALVSAPLGCEISSLGGVFRAGNEDGEVIVSASKDGYYDEARLIVFKEP